MKQLVRVAVFAAVALFVLSPALCWMSVTHDMAFADKDADKGKSDESHGKSDEDHGKDGDKDKGGKGAPSAPELPGLLMIAGAAVLGGGFLLRKRLAGCPEKQ